MRQVIDAEACDHRIETAGVEWQMLSIALTTLDAGKRLLGQLDLSAGEIEADRVSAAPRSRRRDVSGTCRHIKNRTPAATSAPSRLPQCW